MWRYLPCWAECTKIAHRRSLAIFAADSGIAGNSAVGIKIVPFNRRENRRSLAIFFAKEIAHLGALKIARFCGGAVKIAAATAENRAILVHSGAEVWVAELSEQSWSTWTTGSKRWSLSRLFLPLKAFWQPRTDFGVRQQTKRGGVPRWWCILLFWCYRSSRFCFSSVFQAQVQILESLERPIFWRSCAEKVMYVKK